MIVVAYQRTQAGAAQRLAERARTLPAPLEAQKVQPERVEAPVPRVVRLPLTPWEERQRIISLVARMHGSCTRAVMSKSHQRQHVIARQAAMCAVMEFEAHADRDMSLTRLGRIFNRDHTTVLNSFARRGYVERQR